jgi:hypothetical protein
MYQSKIIMPQKSFKNFGGGRRARLTGNEGARRNWERASLPEADPDGICDLQGNFSTE